MPRNKFCPHERNESEAQIQRALKGLESGKYTSLGEAAIAFNVPLVIEECAVRLEKEQLPSAAAKEATVKFILGL